MILVNFSHPLTTEQRTRIEELAGQAIERIVDVPAQLEHGEPFAPQTVGLIEAAGLTPDEWQTLPLLVNLPAYAQAAAVLLAQLHGLMGYFPTALRLRPVAGATPPRFEVAELLALQDSRDQARTQRGGSRDG